MTQHSRKKDEKKSEGEVEIKRVSAADEIKAAKDKAKAKEVKSELAETLIVPSAVKKLRDAGVLETLKEAIGKTVQDTTNLQVKLLRTLSEFVSLPAFQGVPAEKLKTLISSPEFKSALKDAKSGVDDALKQLNTLNAELRVVQVNIKEVGKTADDVNQETRKFGKGNG